MNVFILLVYNWHLCYLLQLKQLVLFVCVTIEWILSGLAVKNCKILLLFYVDVDEGKGWGHVTVTKVLNSSVWRKSFLCCKVDGKINLTTVKNGCTWRKNNSLSSHFKNKTGFKVYVLFADKRYIRYFVAILKGSTAAIQMPGLHNETITVIELICLCLTGQHFN